MSSVSVGGGTQSHVLTPNLIANYAVMGLEVNLFMVLLGSYDYEEAFAHKIGEKLTVKKPFKALAVELESERALKDSDYNSLIDESVEVVVNFRAVSPLRLQNREKTFDVNSFFDRYAMPCGRQLASKFDYAAGKELHNGVHYLAGNTVGGTMTVERMNALRAFSVWHDMPANNMNAVLQPGDIAAINDEIKDYTAPDHLVSEVIRDRHAGKYGGFDLYESVNVPYYEIADYTAGRTSGQTTTPLINGADQDGSSITTDGWGAGTAGRKVLNKGQLITIQGVKDVEPFGERHTLENDRTFLVTADVTANATGEATIPIFPEINDGSLTVAAGTGSGTVTKKAFKTVSELPADNDPITIVGGAAANAGKKFRQGCFFDRTAIQFVNIRMEKVTGGILQGYARDPQTKMAILYSTDANVDDLSETHRLDMTAAVKVTRPEVAMRVITGSAI